MITMKGIDPKMIANNLVPFEPTHPGVLLKEEIEYRGVSQRKLASQIGVSYTMLNEVLNAKRQLNTEMALLIEAALGVDSDMLIKMQSQYSVNVAKQDKTFAQKLNEVRKICAVL